MLWVIPTQAKTQFDRSSSWRLQAEGHHRNCRSLFRSPKLAAVYPFKYGSNSLNPGDPDDRSNS